MALQLSLKRDDILLRLPIETEDLTRTQSSGLEVATLHSQTYNPVYGTVLQVSDTLNMNPSWLRPFVTDQVFFQIFAFSVAKDRCYGDTMNPQFASEYIPVSHMAFKEDDGWKMIIRASSIYFIKRGETIIPLNNYLTEKYSTQELIDLFSQSGKLLYVADLSNKDYQLNEAIISHSPVPWLNPGDHVFTLRHCDITIEEQYNNPILPQNYFIIEAQNIVAIMDSPTTNNGQQATKSYRAGHKRVIIKPDQINTETSSGLINMDIERQKLLTGKVIAVGDNCATWNLNDTVLYARNSGMPIPTDEGDLLVLNDIDVFAVVITNNNENC